MTIGVQMLLMWHIWIYNSYYYPLFIYIAICLDIITIFISLYECDS